MRFYGMDAQPISREEWVRLLEDTDARRVAKDKRDEVTVSTVLLRFDHRFPPDTGPPLIFETMIFGGEHDQDQWRYSTRDEAEAGHAAACALAFGAEVT